MFTYKIFTTNSLSDDFEFTNDMLFEYEYEGIDDVPYMSHGMRSPLGSENVLFVAVDEDSNTVAGCLVLYLGKEGSYEDKTCPNWISSLGVAEQYKGNGISRKLVELFFETCSEKGYSDIIQSSYTVDGKKCLLHIFNEVKALYPNIRFVDYERDF